MLRGAALRVTRPRVAVPSAVRGKPPADAGAIIGVVRRDPGTVSRLGVHHVLRALTAAGPVRCFEPTGSVARYEARVGDGHRHAVRRSCGATAGVDHAVGDTACLAVTGDRYRGIDAEVTYRGRGPACVAAVVTAPGGRS
jgi:Fe2+ or Zn2+ uptake regulation protein